MPTPHRRSASLVAPPFALLLTLCTLVFPAAPLAAQARRTLLLDPDLSMPAGVTTLSTVMDGVSTAQDALLPTRLGAERGVGAKALGIGYRTARFLTLDNAVELYGLVVRHEVFGHGARAREFGLPVSYGLPLPPPYTAGGGWTLFTDEAAFLARSPTEHLLIDIGGMESSNVASRLLAAEWAERGRMTYRESLRYFWSYGDQIEYILSSSAGEGDDVDQYLALLNAAYGPETGGRLTRGTLQKQLLVGLANPLYWLTFKSIFADHLVAGRDTMATPMIGVGGGVRWLPYLRYSLGPFGPQFHLEQLFARDGRVLQLGLRVGDGRFRRSWGVGAAATNILRRGALAADGQLELWHQPAFAIGGTEPRVRSGGLGTMATATLRWRPLQAPLVGGPAGVVVQAGYKTAGFVEGEQLDRGVILRAGLGF